MAVAADLAVRLPAASLAATVLVAAIVGLLAVAGRFDSVAQRTAAALLLVSGGLLSIRASVWVVSMLVASIVALVGLIAADGLTLDQRRPWLRSMMAGLDALYDTVPWIGAGATALSGRAADRLASWLRAAAAGLVVIVVLGALLASGDAAFGWLVSVLDVVSWAGHVGLIALLALPAGALALLAERATAEPSTDRVAAGATAEPSKRRYHAESLTALWAVAATLLVWCGVQLVVLSGGVRNTVLTEQGLTAAEYVRQGFFQLVAVAALSLAVLNAAHRIGRTALTPNRAQRLPAVLIGIGLAALIVVSYSRLGYYVGAFGLTMLRLSVATFLGWLALMTAASVARSLGLHHERNWLPSTAVLSAAAFAIVFGAANPEAVVARVNLERASVEDPVDVGYLTTRLGSDAKETVADYAWLRLGGRPDAVTDWLCQPEPDVGYGPLGWNRSRADRPDVACGS